MADARLQLKHQHTETKTIHMLLRQHAEKMPPCKSRGLLSVKEGNNIKWALIFNCNIFVGVKPLLPEKHPSTENFELCDKKPHCMWYNEAQRNAALHFHCFYMKTQSSVKE